MQSDDEGMNDAADPWIGRVIGERYRIESLLGRGGMGTVYVAEHLQLRNQVALKVIHPQFLGDGSVAARFAQEAMASARIDHPHVASAIDYGTLDDGGAYLVLQLVRGPSLREVLDTRGPMPWGDVCMMGAQIADALAAAHANDIVHRDLKPENILFDASRDGLWARVLDFGIAWVGSENLKPRESGATGKLTAVGTILGTPGYMSPEQAMGQPVDARTDLYALGVVLWESLNGRPLFETDQLPVILTQQLTGSIPPPSPAKQQAVPEALHTLIGMLLTPHEAERPDSAERVRDAFRQIEAGKRPKWLAPPAKAGLSKPAAAGATASDWVTPLSQRGLRIGRWIALACAAIALTLPVLVGIYLASRLSQAAEVRDDPDASMVSKMLNRVLPAKQPAKPEIPEEVQRYGRQLLGGRRYRDRMQAARWLTEHQPRDEVPQWTQQVAALQLARTCPRKRKILLELMELKDPRTRPAVVRLSRTSRRGCGFLDLADCYDCLRGTVARALEEIPSDNTTDVN